MSETEEEVKKLKFSMSQLEDALRESREENERLVHQQSPAINKPAAETDSPEKNRSDHEDKTAVLLEQNKTMTLQMQNLEHELTTARHLLRKFREANEILEKRVQDDSHAFKQLQDQVQLETSSMEGVTNPAAKKQDKSDDVSQLSDGIPQAGAPPPIIIRTKKRKHSKTSTVDMKDPALLESCDKVWKHLKGQNILKADKNGQIDIGTHVEVNMQKFDQVLLNDRLSEIKKINILVTLVYTKSERLQRSLDGQQSNRFQQAPAKQPATPRKVSAILGSIKAGMLHEGHLDNAIMEKKLIECRKAIGFKLAHDGYNSKRLKQR